MPQRKWQARERKLGQWHGVVASAQRRQVVQHCCSTTASLHTGRLYAGISSPVGYRAMLRHFAILAGLDSADQSERSRLTTAEWPVNAMSETSFNKDAFAAVASSPCRGITDSTRKLRSGCTALLSLLLGSWIPQITTKALCCVARLAGVSMKSMCVSVVQCDINVYSRLSSARRSLTP